MLKFVSSDDSRLLRPVRARDLELVDVPRSGGLEFRTKGESEVRMDEGEELQRRRISFGVRDRGERSRETCDDANFLLKLEDDGTSAVV